MQTDRKLLLTAIVVTICAAFSVLLSAAEEERPRQESPVQANEVSLASFIESLDPPTVNEVIASLEQIPTLQDCLAPLPDDPKTPYHNLLAGENKERVEELEEQITRLRERAEYAGAVSLAAEIFAIRARVQGDGHWETADANRHATLSDAQAQLAQADQLGPQIEVLFDQGEYDSTLGLASSQLVFRKRALGLRSEETLRSVDWLALLSREKGDHVAAKKLCCTVPDLYREVLGDEHADVAVSLSNLALVLQDRGNYG